MRQEILNYVNGLSLGTFSVSSELPYDQSGTALYLSNPKKIYVGNEQTSTEPLVSALDGPVIDNEVTTVSIYFSADAKQLPANYDTLVTNLRAAKNITTVTGIHRRELDAVTEFQGDLIVNSMEIRFNKVT
tara:strand:+ start:1054 stop:1446 length:393 start_codon:yes stop_codon:yes gene_type:complete